MRRRQRKPALWLAAADEHQRLMAPPPRPRTRDDDIHEARIAWEQEQLLRYDVMPYWWRHQREAYFRAAHPHLFKEQAA